MSAELSIAGILPVTDLVMGSSDSVLAASENGATESGLPKFEPGTQKTTQEKLFHEKGFEVALEFFSGPMDLLLHLVHQQEVNIEKVSMTLIAEQYLKVIGQAQFLDLEKAAEYLVIAATLMSIKSASLLPANITEQDQANPEEMGEEFYEELRARLKAYELTKSRAKALTELPQLGVDIFPRVDRKALLPTPEMLAEPEEAGSLAMIFGGLLRRIGKTVSSYRIRVESISVVSYMMKIVDTLGGGESSHKSGLPREAFNFRTLLRSFIPRGQTKQGIPDSGSEAKDGIRAVSRAQARPMVIGSFCAVLELVKRGLIRVSQPGDQAEIQIELALAEYGGAESGSINSLPTEGLESEFDAIGALDSSPYRESDRSDKSSSENPGFENSEADDSKVVHMAEYQQQQQRKTSGVTAEPGAEKSSSRREVNQGG